MVRAFPFRASRIAHGFAWAFCLASVACSGGGSGSTGPDDPTGPGPGDPHGPGPGDPQDPGPPQLPNDVIGSYALISINDGTPGQQVLLSNPDGSAIGLYRFNPGTRLNLRNTGDWALALRFEDNGNAQYIDDAGRFRIVGEALDELAFTSAVYGDAFEGRAREGLVAIKYDFDGDGQADTFFGFQKLVTE